MTSPAASELSINLAGLLPPDRRYYANTATFRRCGSLFSFGFAQFTIGRTNSIQSGMGFDIPDRAIKSIVSTFDAGFRTALSKLMNLYEPMPAFPEPGIEIPRTSVYPAHLVRAHVSDLECALDFYCLGTEIGAKDTDLKSEPLIRIRCFVPVVAFFVRACDDIVKEARK